MNDLTNAIPETKTALFADDTTLLSSGETPEIAADKMNQTLERIAEWFKQNKLNLNPSKTRYMILSLIHI